MLLDMSDQFSEFGIFGPESLAWKIHSHPSAWIGAIRALLIQALEPRAMAGVAQFSQFGENTWQRFRTTSEFIMALTYKSRPEAEAAIARVRKIHEPIVGIDPYTNQPFSANDPYLLAYVHNCLVDSLLAAYMTFSHRLSLREQDQYVAEMYEVARLIGADLAEVPRTASGLAEWLCSQKGLVVTREARLAAETLRDINLHPNLRQLWNVAWNASLSIMPPYALELYGFDISVGSSVVYKKLARIIAGLMRLTLPSHPYYREAKFSFYDHYSRNEGQRCLNQIEHLVMDLLTITISGR